MGEGLPGVNWLNQQVAKKPECHVSLYTLTSEPSFILFFFLLVPSGHILPDTQNAPRGVGIKIFNVDGPKMKETNPEKGGWHDVFFNNSPILELKDVSSVYESEGMIGLCYRV